VGRFLDTQYLIHATGVSMTPWYYFLRQQQ